MRAYIAFDNVLNKEYPLDVSMSNTKLASGFSINAGKVSPSHTTGARAALLFVLAIAVPPSINLLPYWSSNPLYGCGLLVPVLAAMLFYRAENTFSGPNRSSLRVGAFAILIFYFLFLPVVRIVQLANPDWRFLDWCYCGGAILALLAFAFLLGGSSLFRRAFVPACFLLLAVPWPTSIERVVTQGAIPATASAASELAWLLNVSAADTGRTILTAVGPVSVTEACSGIRSLYLALISTMFWASWFALGSVRGVFLVLAGIGIALLINVLRVTSLVMIATGAGELAAADRWHDITAQVAQLLLIAAVPIVAILLEKTLPNTAAFESSKYLNAPKGLSLPRGAALLAVVAIAWGVISELAAEAWFKSRERNLPQVTRFWSLREPEVVSAETKPIAQAVREGYRFTDAQHLKWKAPKGEEWELHWLYFDKGTISNLAYNIHQPEVCLLSGDYSLERQLPDLEVNVDGETLLFHHKRFRRSGQVLHLFHASMEEGMQASVRTAPDWGRGGRIKAAWERRRSQQVSLVHLQALHPYTDAEARTAASEYLKKLLVRKAAEVVEG